MRNRRLLSGALLVASLLTSARAGGADLFTTFTIVARDASTGEVGVAACSRAPSVGAVVPSARAGVGAVAAQAWTEAGLAPRALELLGEGLSPRDALARLLDQDPLAERRQFAVVSASGVSASHTGRETLAYAGAIEGADFVVLGNLLTGRATIEEMAASFRESGRATGATGKEALPLAERLLRALEAGQAAGGDRRGSRSAALLTVSTGPPDDRVDLRVDDHETPVPELRRIYDARTGRLGYRRLFRPAGRDVAELQELLKRAGFFEREPDGIYDDGTVAAVQSFRRAQGLYAGGEGGDDGLVDSELIARLRAFVKPHP